MTPPRPADLSASGWSETDVPNDRLSVVESARDDSGSSGESGKPRERRTPRPAQPTPRSSRANRRETKQLDARQTGGEPSGSKWSVSGALSALGRDMAVDLGTANTLVYVRGRGVVLDEPSVVALDQRTGAIVAVGTTAKQMLGRTPDGIVAIRPLKNGVVSDFETTERMLRYFIQKVHGRRTLAKPRLVICVPSGITAVEQRAVKDAGYAAGARRVFVIEEPMAAAIGAGLPVHDAEGSMVVDIGGGTTEVAVISLGGIVTSISARVGGDQLDDAIVHHVKKEYSLLLGERTAEDIKIRLGSAFPTRNEPQAQVRGRDLISGLPRTVVLTAEEIRRALHDPVTAVVDAVRTTLDRTPPELAGDVMDSGIVLTGGGALLKGLDERLRHETGMPVMIAQDPASCVALGTGRCVEDFEALKPVLLAESRY